MSDDVQLTLVVDNQPAAGPCFGDWTNSPIGYHALGRTELPCLQETAARTGRALLEWRWIVAATTPRVSSVFPETEISQQVTGMLRFERYYIHAVTVLVLAGHTPRKLPLGRFELDGLPQRRPNTKHLLSLDPFTLRDRETGSVLLRTRIQLRADKEFYLGLGRQSGRELSMLSARFHQVDHA